jgi:hypothetical protein
MLSIQDCLDFCDLTEEEIAMVAHHEHLPYPSAIQLACCLVQTDEGTKAMRCILKDCVCEADTCGGALASAEARRALNHFAHAHKR